jgi:predicted PurR-regulated permease PerM
MESKYSMINSDLIKKIIAITVLIGLYYSMRSLMNLFLLTFFLTYIFYNIQKFIFRLLHRCFPMINRKEIAVVVYILLCSFLVMILYMYTPMTIKQLIGITHQMSKFNLNNLKGIVNDRVINLINSLNIQGYISNSSSYVFNSLSEVGEWGVEIFISLVLSLMFTLEKVEIQKFMLKFRDSKIGFMYDSAVYFGKIFLNSFGKIMRIQMITAAISAVVTFIWLTLIGFHQVLGFAIMMLIFTFVPVIGVLICLVPLSIVAFRIGGMIKLANILIMIVVIHTLESYVIKPKLMAIEIRIPIFIIFIILIISEHFMGVWGLLLGLPLFMFLLDILGLRM